ncbi:NACHT domain-containing protein [Nonomuraea sp. NPDC049784]|uniref:NACHT domain-containing protein n=1 Tax=Nonomuraea sp. NPDC049784 TaxID=3154361 RepID=UPI0034049140
MPWRIAAAALAIIALATVVVVVARAVKPGAEVNLADVAAVALAAVTAIAAVVAWAKQPPPAGTAAALRAETPTPEQVLAGLVQQQWETEARLRSLHDPEPIPVIWRPTDDRRVMNQPQLIIPQAPFILTGRSDNIAALARDFRALKYRRLVITGEPGMGKTTLAVQLLLQLLASRAADQADAAKGDVVPVPVLLPVSGWDRTVHPGLQEWLADRLTQDYPALAAPELGTGAATALVQGGHILPVLDGLDEVGEDARAEVIAALNASLRPSDQIILTSRTAEFAAAAAGRPLTGATVVIPAPLTPQAAADYLRSCLAEEPPRAWEPVLNALLSHVAPGPAKTAITPLDLWLIRAVYMAPGTDPAPLTGLLADGTAALRSHLLDRLIPALIARERIRPPGANPAHHFRPRRSLDPDATHRYLTYLAHAFPPATTRDIAWWRIARTTPHIRRLTGLVFGLVFGLASGLVLGLASRTWVDETPGYASLRGRPLPPLHTIKTRLMGGLAVGQVVGLTVGLTGGLTGGDESGFVFGLAAGIVLGPVVGLMVKLAEWAERPTLTSTSTPHSTWRSDRTLTLLRTLAVGLVVGLTVGLTVGFVFGLVFGLAGGFVFGLVFGLVFGPTAGNHHAWLVCTIAISRLALTRRLPWRLMDFLDDAHRLGLLRAVGPVYQFRHADLHDHLAAAPPR